MDVFPGFLYIETTHTYLLFGIEMTGCTTILKVGGDNENLVSWAGNNDSAEAFLIAQTMDAKRLYDLSLLIKSFPKIDYLATKVIDKEFPEFKQARLKHTSIKNKAGGVGKDAHKIVELFEENKLPTGTDMSGYDPASVKRAGGYVKWYQSNVKQTYFTERPVFSKTYFVAGTPDGGVQMVDLKNLIKDTKFKTGLYSPHPVWQMAMYRMMMEEMRLDEETPVRLEWEDGRVEEYKSPKEYLASWGNVNWDGCVVIQVDEDGNVEPVYRYAYEEDVRRAIALIDIYRGIQAWPKPKMKWQRTKK